MRALITHITAATLLFHMLLGCCAHHGHDVQAATQPPKVHTCCGSQEKPKERKAATRQDAGKSCDKALLKDQSESDSPCAPSRCSEWQCVFVGATNSQFAQHQAITAIAYLGNCPALPCSSAVCAVFDEAAPPLPLKRHLYFQILLI